jgi:hypothetical protein
VRSQALGRGLLAVYAVSAMAAVVVSLAWAAEPDEAVLAVLLAGFAVAGRLLTARRPDNAVGWVLAWAAAILAVDGLAVVYAAGAPTSAPRASVEAAAWVSDWIWYLWVGLVGVALPLLFPGGRLPSRRWRKVAWAGAAGTLLGLVSAALRPGRIDVDSAEPIENPFGLAGAADELSAMAAVAAFLTGGAFLCGGAAVIGRLRRARGIERQQLKLFAYVLALMATGLVVASVVAATGEENGAAGLVGAVGWLSAIGMVLIGIPVATGVAILRYRLYDIDLVIRRTLIYGALTATLVASYLGSVLMLQLALDPVTSGSSLAVAASTLAVAALFRPVRARIQAIVDRRFYRRRYDAARAVEEFGVRLRDEVDVEALGSELREVVSQTMQPAHVSLWLRSG